MNEPIPTPEPNDVPPKTPTPIDFPSDPGTPPPVPAASKPPSRGMCIFLGFLLCVVSTALCFLMPPLIVVGLGAAIVSLFFKGYRGIGLGYFLTIGVALLGTIIYCSTHPFRME